MWTRAKLCLLPLLTVACRIGYDPLPLSADAGSAAASGTATFGGDTSSNGGSAGGDASGGAGAFGGDLGTGATSSDGGQTDTAGASGEGGTSSVAGEPNAGGSSEGGASGGGQANGGTTNVAGTGGSGGTAGGAGSAGTGGSAGNAGSGGGGTVPNPQLCPRKTFNGHDYLLCHEERNWNDANAGCTAAGMRLARIDDAVEDLWLTNNMVVLSGQSTQVWIGGTDQAVEGDWRWSDGTLFWIGNNFGTPQNGLYTDWYFKEPNDVGGNEDCASLELKNSQWIDSACSLVWPFICESL
jgi:hypothetical protein